MSELSIQPITPKSPKFNGKEFFLTEAVIKITCTTTISGCAIHPLTKHISRCAHTHNLITYHMLGCANPTFSCSNHTICIQHHCILPALFICPCFSRLGPIDCNSSSLINATRKSLAPLEDSGYSLFGSDRSSRSHNLCLSSSSLSRAVNLYLSFQHFLVLFGTFVYFGICLATKQALRSSCELLRTNDSKRNKLEPSGTFRNLQEP